MWPGVSEWHQAILPGASEPNRQGKHAGPWPVSPRHCQAGARRPHDYLAAQPPRSKPLAVLVKTLLPSALPAALLSPRLGASASIASVLTTAARTPTSSASQLCCETPPAGRLFSPQIHREHRAVPIALLTVDIGQRRPGSRGQALGRVPWVGWPEAQPPLRSVCRGSAPWQARTVDTSPASC